MEFKPGELYHVYNRGNDRLPIFYERENYYFFLRKMRRHLISCADIFAYCLMPNHFHWMLHVPDLTCTNPTQHPLNQQIGTLLSSYTKGMNNRYNRTGSLFQQKTKAVHLNSQIHALTCFHYIHQNPIRAGLVKNIGEWPYASFKDYAGARKGTLVAKDFTLKMLNISENNIIEESKNAIDPQKIKKIY